MGLAKILLFIFNLIFVILGIILIVSGALIHTSDKNFDIIETDLPFAGVGTLTIILGVVVFIIAFAGCCGAIKENKFLLTVFIVLLVIVLIVEIAGAVLGFLYQGQVEGKITEGLMKGLDQYNSTATAGEEAEYTKVWDETQIKFSCCGVNSSSDWIGSNATFPSGNSYPNSCCGANATSCTLGSKELYPIGCKDFFIDQIAGNLLFSGAACIVILLAEIFGILFACCVIRENAKDGEHV